MTATRTGPVTAFAPPGAEIEVRRDGTRVLRSTIPLPPVPPSLGAALAHWADVAPDRVLVAGRDGDGWRPVTYAEALDRAASVGAALVERGLGPDRPLMILSGNDVDQALLTLGAMHVGVPVAPVSPAYSLLSRDHARLRHVFALLRPGLVFAADADGYRRALAALPLDGVEVVVADGKHPGATRIGELLEVAPSRASRAAAAAVGPDTVAKILFTSGSTGAPKGVINTQGMLCSNQCAIRTLWPFLARRPPVLVDWLPWSHTFGGNHNFNMMLCNGGTLWIDDGSPAPDRIGRTVEHLHAVSPTLYFNVPRGYAALLPWLEADETLAQRFFASLDLVFYAAAALPANLWQRIERLATAVRGEPVAMISAWGATETAPAMTVVHYGLDGPGNIGVPVPGSELKLVPDGERLEIRARGPNVTPGYWRDPTATADAFDGEGFWRTGDAGRLADPDDPSRGLVFDGRVAENFKLDSGTWVHTGALRIAAIAAVAPVAQDAVVAGHDREEVGLLVFPDPDGCRSLPGGGDDPEPWRAPAVREALRAGLARHNERHPASSTRIARALLLSEPPSIDANEITDKGYINQRAVLERRAALVEKLYSDDPEVILVS